MKHVYYIVRKATDRCDPTKCEAILFPLDWFTFSMVTILSNSRSVLKLWLRLNNETCPVLSCLKCLPFALNLPYCKVNVQRIIKRGNLKLSCEVKQFSFLKMLLSATQNLMGSGGKYNPNVNSTVKHIHEGNNVQSIARLRQQVSPFLYSGSATWGPFPFIENHQMGYEFITGFWYLYGMDDC